MMADSWKHVPHNWKPLKAIGREWCHRCGLVRLHNAATDWCVKHGCDSDEHPQYKREMRRLTTKDGE